MGNNNCCGCNENGSKHKKTILMKQKVNVKQKTNVTQENKHITDKELETLKSYNNEDKISKLDLSEIKAEFHECESVKVKKTANIMSMKQSNSAHQNTPVTDPKAYAPNHNQDKDSAELSKIDVNIFKDENNINKCNKNGINNDPIESCKPLKRLISSLKYYQMLDVINNKDHQN
eukprot:213565_1